MFKHTFIIIPTSMKTSVFLLFLLIFVEITCFIIGKQCWQYKKQSFQRKFSPIKILLYKIYKTVVINLHYDMNFVLKIVNGPLLLLVHKEHLCLYKRWEIVLHSLKMLTQNIQRKMDFSYSCMYICDV